MKASELRIGNTVMKQNKYDSVEEIHTVHLGDLGPFTVKELIPIPLTEEWLLRFGFKALSNGWVKVGAESKGLGLQLITDKDRGLVCATMSGVVSWNIIKYVHQLQNLYFALTGEELTIKQEPAGPKSYPMSDEG